MVTVKENKKGLVERQDDLIYIEQDGFENTWSVLKTRTGSNTSTVIFTFETKGAAAQAGLDISEVIGGSYHHLIDPRIG